MMIAKYSASGNDFVICHSFLRQDRSALARTLCDRQNGIGADGLIVLLPHETCDCAWEFYNSDGSSAQMCGNGSRAAAHYAYYNDLAPATMTLMTEAGVIRAEVQENMVSSDLTPPHIDEREIHVNGKMWWLIDTGVPHLVTFDAPIEHFDLKEARQLRERYNANVNIAVVLPDGNLRVRTYERGVENETLACGTGMAAVFYRALMEARISGDCKVFPQSGETLYLGMHGQNITFKGVVKACFEVSWNDRLQ